MSDQPSNSSRGVDRKVIALPAAGEAASDHSRDVGEAKLVVPGSAGVRENARSASFDLAGSMLAGFGVLAVVGVIVAASWLSAVKAAQRVERADPAEAAFRSLCRRLRVTRSQRGVLRQAAGQMGCEPVALLVSTSAIERALGAATPATLGVLEVVRRRVSV